MTQNNINNSTSQLTLDPGASGDSYSVFNINATSEFVQGVDDTDGDSFKISQGSTLGTNDTLKIDSIGARTLPLQPTFLAYKSAATNNQTGDGTVYTIICDTEVWDIGSDYNNATGVFTAPMTNVYSLTGYVQVNQVLAAMTSGEFLLVTSNRTYIIPGLFNPGTYKNGTAGFAGGFILRGKVLADMDAGDTAYLTIALSGSTLTADIDGGTVLRTFFSGLLSS